MVAEQVAYHPKLGHLKVKGATINNYTGTIGINLDTYQGCLESIQACNMRNSDIYGYIFF